MGGFCPGGFVQGDFVWGDFVLGGFCPGGFCLGDFVLGGILSRGILSGGFCPGGFCPRTPCNMQHFILPTHVAMKYGGSNMADKWQKQCFFKNINHELWAIGRSCQNSVTAVRN